MQNDTTFPAMDASGRFVLRIHPNLHIALREAALRSGQSLNQYCAKKLAMPDVTSPDEKVTLLIKARNILKEALIGVVLFGSWARGEHGQNSDVDVLIIVDHTIHIGRRLYHQWDESSVQWNGLVVEPHFVHLPKVDSIKDKAASSMWAEVAIDGVVLCERNLEVSTWLRAVRQQIVKRRLIRRYSHGQPYWMEAVDA